jgi:PDZ domain-containing protein
MSRRSATLLVAGIGAFLLAVAGAVLPVPYVVLAPGPSINTLGSGTKGQPLLQISGHPVYKAAGNLNLVTVTFAGGPGDEINLFTALRSWLQPHDAVVPQSEIFGSSANSQQIQQQNAQQMTGSQETATAAALTELKIPYQTQVSIAQTVRGMPAYGVLRPGDVLVAVDGHPVTGQDQAASLIAGRRPGSPVQLAVNRAGQTLTQQVATAGRGGRAEIGVVVQDQFKFPFNVRISVGAIGGPSAGMMFALGIIDKLTPDNLTGGRFVAGTGEIEAGGKVDPIGGIQQKMAGARNDGATVFLAPAGNCSDVKGAVPAGLRVIKVATLDQAVQDLQALKAGKPTPSC